jgi:hypothetical protein
MKRFASSTRLRLLAGVGAACVMPAAVASASVPAKSPTPRTLRLVAFHSRFGGSRFGGGALFGRRRTYGYGYRGRYYSRPSLFHRIARALAFAYILHLLFTNGAFSILLWVLIIAVFSHLFRRFPRRYSY